MSLIKKIFNHPVLLVLGYITFLAGIFLVGTFFGIRRIPDTVQYVQNRLVPIYQGHSVNQTVTVGHNGFNVVVIYLRNASVKNNDRFIFNLINSQGQIVRTINLNGYNIGDGTDVRFQFAPLPDSNNQTYTISLAAPDTVTGQPKIEVGFSNADTYLAGSSSVTPGDMSFQLYYRPQSYSALMNELSRQLLIKLSSSPFIVSSIVFVILSIIVIKSKFRF